MIGVALRQELSPRRELGVRLAACAAAIIASMAIMACMRLDPFAIYQKIIEGSVGSAYRIRGTVTKAVPLIMLSLGTGLAFRMKFWNIGAEGQFYMGAFGASIAAFAFPDMTPALLLPLMALLSLIFGALWCLVPAALKLRTGANETLVTLMFNYIAQKWVSYLQYGPWRDPAGNGFPKIARFSPNAVLPSVFGVHIGWIIMLVTALLLYIMIKRTKQGYEISVVGDSPNTARYAGINVPRVILITVALSGGLCGLAGMMEASAIENSLSENLSGGLGFTAVITAWLAQLDPLATVIVSFLFSMLIQGGRFLQSSLQIPASMSQILQGIIIFFVLGSEFFVRYRLVRRKSGRFPWDSEEETK